MQAFMDKDFLLSTPTARTLYHDVAAKCPIIDYHCHISPREIYEDLRYETITQVWLGGDHYKWRLMRCAGVPEKYITGKETSDYEKFVKWAEVIGKSIGNPLYHWSHLELRRFFGYEGTLSARTADEVWNLCNRKLQSPGYSVRGLIAMSNVETICTTDDPIDTLEWHQKLAADDTFHTVVLPAWRPDKAMNLEKADYPEYLSKLSAASGVTIDSFSSLKEALRKRMDHFAQNRCCLSDHALNYVMYAPASEEEVEAIFRKRLAGDAVTEREQAIFKTAFMFFAAHEYRQRNWTMQLHYGCRRDNNRTMTAWGRIPALTASTTTRPPPRPLRSSARWRLRATCPKPYSTASIPTTIRPLTAFAAASRARRRYLRFSTDQPGGSTTTWTAWRSSCGIWPTSGCSAALWACSPTAGPSCPIPATSTSAAFCAR